MDTNKMREQFEAWAWREYGQLLWWDMNYSEVFRRNGESYLTEFLSVRWEAWQASLEAVVVELPAENPLGSGPGDCEGGLPSFDQHCAAECNNVLFECRAAIEAHGLKVAP